MGAAAPWTEAIMKLSILAGALLIAGLAACGGGSSSGTIPAALPTASAVPQNFAKAQAVGPSPGLPYVAVSSPAGAAVNASGETLTLAAAVPVYNIGTNSITFEFVANSQGVPVAVQVGTVTSLKDLNASTATGYIINGKTSIFCFGDGFNFNNGAIPSAPTDTTGVTYFDYFACNGNPFI